MFVLFHPLSVFHPVFGSQVCNILGPNDGHLHGRSSPFHHVDIVKARRKLKGELILSGVGWVG